MKKKKKIILQAIAACIGAAAIVFGSLSAPVASASAKLEGAGEAILPGNWIVWIGVVVFLAAGAEYLAPGLSKLAAAFRRNPPAPPAPPAAPPGGAA